MSPSGEPIIVLLQDAGVGDVEIGLLSFMISNVTDFSKIVQMDGYAEIHVDDESNRQSLIEASGLWINRRRCVIGTAELDEADLLPEVYCPPSAPIFVEVKNIPMGVPILHVRRAIDSVGFVVKIIMKADTGLPTMTAIVELFDSTAAARVHRSRIFIGKCLVVTKLLPGTDFDKRSEWTYSFDIRSPIENQPAAVSIDQASPEQEVPANQNDDEPSESYA